MAAAIPYIIVAMAVAGTAVSVYSTAQAGEAAKEAREREAAQLEASAAQARRAAALRASDTEKRHRSLLAAQRARYAASGLTMEGSPLLVQAKSIEESREEIRKILEEGEIGAGGYLAAAGEAERQGRAARTSGYVGAFGEAVRGTGTIERVGRNYGWWSE